MKYIQTNLVLLLLLTLTSSTFAQVELSQDFSQLMEIPEITTMSASESHLYVMSDLEGLAVFRLTPEKVQWLYTSAGMQQRGTKILTDVRFAYLFGDSNRLTILEPTNVLGVYSATMLPSTPRSVARLKNDLYIALGDLGLGMLSLKSPESVDSVVVYPFKEELGDESILDVKASQTGQQLFVLSDQKKLYVFAASDAGLRLNRTVELRSSITQLFSTTKQLYGVNSSGDVFEIRTRGLGLKITTIDEPISDVLDWNGTLFIRAKSGRTWYYNNLLFPYKQDILNRNFITSNSQTLWIAENNKISTVLIPDSVSTDEEITTDLVIQEIPDRVLTYPNQLIQPFIINKSQPITEVEFSVRSDLSNYKVRGQSLYWRPGPEDMGNHSFTVFVNRTDGQSDSTQFNVDVRSFNSPPRFSPVRPISIGVDEAYELDFLATDPESLSSNLVRYIGVDLPDGSTLNEDTGKFTWTPSAQQAGKNIFKIIATDQLGAASTVDVTITVLEINRDQ